MIRASILITVSYPNDGEYPTMEDAEDDKAEFMQGVVKNYWPQVPVSNIHIDYTLAEATHEQG